MKKIKCFSAAFLALICSLPLFAFSENSAPPPPRVLVLGDSISSGFGLEGYLAGDDNAEISRYGNLFARSLGSRQGSEYFNHTIDGETSAGLLWRLENSIEANEDFDAVIISSGGNDLLDSFLPSAISLISEFTGKTYKDAQMIKKLAEISKQIKASTKILAENTFKNLDKSLGIIKEKNPNAYIGVISIYNPFDGAFDSAMLNVFIKTILDPGIKAINESISKAAEENGVEFINIYDKFVGRSKELTNIKNFDIHPNAEGHKVIFETLQSSYNAHNTKDVFAPVNYNDASDFWNFTTSKTFKKILAVTTICGATLFGCICVLISFEKYGVTLKKAEK